MAAASSRWRPACEAGCKTFFVADLARRGACARLRRSRRFMCSTACCPATAASLRRSARAAGDRQHGRTGRMGRLLLRQRMAGRRSAARRHRHEPARHLANEAAALAPRIRAGKSRHHAADEPPRLLGSARASAQRAPDRGCSAKCACSIAASPPRSPTRPAYSSAIPPIATWCGRASRCTASIRRRAAAIRCAR